jgi:hypothetical protein
MKHRLPTVLSTVALVVALLGATPAGQAARNLVLPKGSVGTPQLKNGAVTTPKLKNGAVKAAKLAGAAVTTAKVLNGSLLAEDFKAGEVPKGEKGDPGTPGVSAWERVTAESPNDSNVSKTVIATCPAGKKILGGGALILSALVAGPALVRDAPDSDTSWLAQGREINATGSNWKVVVQAICATVS